jgi:hypothetical protein
MSCTTSGRRSCDPRDRLRRGGFPTPRSSGLAGRGLAQLRSLGLHRPKSRALSRRGRSPARRALCLPRKSFPGHNTSRLALQFTDCGARSLARRSLPRAPSRSTGGRGAPLRPFTRARRRSWQVDTGSSGLREPDRDRLLRGPRAVLSLTNVPNLLVHEFAGLRRRRSALSLRRARLFQRRLLRHFVPS